MSLRRDILFRFLGDSKKLDAASRDAERSLERVEKGGGKSSTSLGGLATAAKGLAVAFVAAEIGQFATQSFNLAVSAEEAGSAFNTTFGPAVDDAQQFVDEFANKAGLAEFELKQLMATSGNVALGLGATKDEASELSQRISVLAGDVASFSNAQGGAQAVSEALRSAITGETDSLKTYGIVIRQADVVQQALTETGKTQAAELTDLEKAMATMTLAYERAGEAVGDLDRTQDSRANKIRQLSAAWKETQVVVGDALIPVFDALLPILETLGPLVAALGELVGKILVQAFEVLGPVIELTVAILDKAIDALGWVADQVGNVKSTVVDAADFMLGPFINFADETERAADEQGYLSDALDTAIDKARADAQAALDNAAAHDEMAGEIRDATDAALEAADPAFKLQKAYERQQTAIENLENATGEDLVKAQQDLLVATAELDAAQRTYTDSAPDAEAALRDLAAQAGFTDLATQSLIARYREYNQQTIDPKTFSVRAVLTGALGGVGDYVSERDDIQILHGGGVVAGPIGQERVVIAKGGETVLPTHKGPVSLPVTGTASTGAGADGRVEIIEVHIGDIGKIAEAVRKHDKGIR